MRMSLLNIFWSLPSPLLFMRNLKRQTSLKLSTHGRKNLLMLCFSKKMFGIFTRGHFNNSKNCILRFYYVFNTIKNSSSITQYRGIRIALPIVAQHDKKTVVHQWKTCYIHILYWISNTLETHFPVLPHSSSSRNHWLGIHFEYVIMY